MSRMNETQLTLGSLFDGSGGFPLGGLLSGITPVWASEIEPFPIRVTTKRLPQMKHYGDVSCVNGADLEPVDIITFGSPCQDMSIAGKRAGLDGAKSSLFYEAIRIIKEMREKTNGEKPRWIVWENVFGAFSSNKGEDFRAVLEAVIRIKEPTAQVSAPEKGQWPYADTYLGDGWSVAYRTLDAQYWGVAQRRRRIYLVADFAGAGAGKVLFESEGLSGYTPQGFRTRKRTAGGSEESTGATGGCGGGCVLNDQGGSRMDVTEEVACTLRAEAHHPPVVLDEEPMKAGGFCTEHSKNARSIGYQEECSPTLRAGVVPAAVALENHPNDSRIKVEEDGKVQTLSGRMGTGGGNVPLLMEKESTPVTLKIRSGCEGGGKGILCQQDKSATLACNNDQTVFVPEPSASCYWDGGQTAGTLTDKNARGVQRMPDKQNFNCVLEAENDEALGQQAFGISSYCSHAMLSDNPHAGIYEASLTHASLLKTAQKRNRTQSPIPHCHLLQLPALSWDTTPESYRSCLPALGLLRSRSHVHKFRLCCRYCKHRWFSIFHSFCITPFPVTKFKITFPATEPPFLIFLIHRIKGFAAVFTHCFSSKFFSLLLLFGIPVFVLASFRAEYFFPAALRLYQPFAAHRTIQAGRLPVFILQQFLLFRGQL